MPSDVTSLTRTAPGFIWKLLAEFNLPDQPGSDRLAGEQTLEVLKELDLSRTNRSRLKNAIAAALLNTIEPDHQQSKRLICVRILISEPVSSNQETIQSQEFIPNSTSLISGQPLQRGWGFFLIHKTENLEQTQSEEGYYLIELFLYREDDFSRPDLKTGEVL